MAVSVTAFSASLVTNVAAVASAMTPITEAEVTGVALVLAALAQRQDLMNHLIKLANTTAVTPA